MKRVMIILGIILLPLSAVAQPLQVRHLLRSCDTGREVTRIHLPPVLIRLVSWCVDDEETRHVLRNVSSLYLVTSEDSEFSQKSDFPTRVVNKLRNNNFEEMLIVNDKGERVVILMRENRRNVKEMVIAVDGDEDTVIYLKGRLDLNEIMESQDIHLAGINP